MVDLPDTGSSVEVDIADTEKIVNPEETEVKTGGTALIVWPSPVARPLLLIH